jgi:hypothetical protein
MSTNVMVFEQRRKITNISCILKGLKGGCSAGALWQFRHIIPNYVTV